MVKHFTFKIERKLIIFSHVLYRLSNANVIGINDGHKTTHAQFSQGSHQKKNPPFFHYKSEIKGGG